MHSILSCFLYPLLLITSETIKAAHPINTQYIVDQYSSGGIKRIIQTCKRNSSTIINKELKKNSSKNLILENNQIQQYCAIIHFLSQLEEKKVVDIQEFKDKKFTLWLFENYHILEQLAWANTSEKNTLKIIREIWNKDHQLTGTHLNLALGCAINANNPDQEQILLDKYEYYKHAYNEKKLFPQFETLEPWEMSLLFQGPESVEEMKWANQYLDKKKADPNNISNKACSLIPYRDHNPQGVSVHKGGAFYDNKPVTLMLYVEYGGVCGAVSKGACGFLRSKGIPAYTIGQPGHCAFVWKNINGIWHIGNNIYGWSWSTGSSKLPWKGYTAIIKAIEQYQKHCIVNLLCV